MRPASALTLLGWCILCPGCALIEDGSRNFCVALSTPIETHRENARNRKWAEAAWQEICSKPGPAVSHSDDFARGFKEGYAEYLFRGGDGEPPLVAPLRYRHIRYQTPDGYRAKDDWFAGYRYGAAVARDTGARNWITGPSGLHGEAIADTEIRRIQIDEPVVHVPPPQRLMPAQTAEVPPPDDQRIEIEAPLTGLTREPPIGFRFTSKIDEPKPAPGPKVEAEPAPAKVKIMQVREAPPSVLEATRVRITGINVSPTPEAQTAPARARITTITVAPPKE